MSALVATRPIIAAKLSAAALKNYTSGVLGLRAQASWDGSTFTHDGVPVTVAACPSTLAVWEALETRRDGQWLVILTPVEEDQLGIGVLAQLVDLRLLSPDPWDALRSNFSATTLEPALYRVQNDRAFAVGLLTMISSDAYIPARGGVLTRDHALAAVARGALHMTDDPSVEIDALATMEWSRQPGAAEDFAHLRTDGGTEVADVFTEWLAGRCGRLGRAVAALLRTGRIADLVPLGLITGLLDPAVAGGQRALGLFEGRYDLGGLRADELRGWYEDSASLVMGTLTPAQCQVVLGAAGKHVHDLGIEELVQRSELLPQGLEARIASLAAAIDDVLPAGAIPPLPLTGNLGAVEDAWQNVQQHFLVGTDPTCRAFTAAVRLVRWLARPDDSASALAPLVQRHVDVDAWVDAALATARGGAASPAAAATLRRVIELAGTCRREHDQEFAAALADAAHPRVLVIEDLLRKVVFPLAKSRPTLLLVLDALSMAVATELVRDAGESGWTEAAVLGGARRTGALAVLPTLTQRSRCSLLCGELREGDSHTEHVGFVSALREAGLQAGPGVPDPIFHKRALDSIPAGAALATDVSNALADTETRPLVAAVLNYVDDTLHHTDPGGADWTLTTITHLRALLKAARASGRVVLMTSDHGHIIERRDSVKRQRSVTYGQRAHGDVDNIDDGEVLVRGPRVLTDTRTAVLAVDERIRYGPVNAGYHGGGSPAEAVIPVIALHTGDRPVALSALTTVEPEWWNAPAILPVAQVFEPVVPRKKAKPVMFEPGLFDSDANVPAPAGPKLAEKVVKTRMFANQLRLAGQIRVTTDQIAAVLTALLAAPAHELTPSQAAVLLDVPAGRVNGALLQIKRVLDVEGYEVLLMAPGSVRVDESALCEQFGVSP